MLWNWRWTCQSEGSMWRCCLWGRGSVQPENLLLPAAWPSVLKQGCVPHRECAEKHLPRVRDPWYRAGEPEAGTTAAINLPGNGGPGHSCFRSSAQQMEGMPPSHSPYCTDHAFGAESLPASYGWGKCHLSKCPALVPSGLACRALCCQIDISGNSLQAPESYLFSEASHS